ncbi:MAG: hypothetical protein HYS27_23565 [Deltaproteobacteria bacterium]|nr:hypothetical protein [Deltaproteobacteria bacterium]
MPLDETTEAELLAYAYGELPAAAARAFEQRLQGDVELQAELAGIKATRELFGRDHRWGTDAKVDVPPPHLLDAIVRAEALARPAAIRDARAIAPRPTLTARLSRWLIGGGVLVGATAALFIVVTQSGRDAVMVSMPTAAEPAPPAPPADQPMAAADAPAPEGALAKNEETAGDSVTEKADGKLAARAPEPLPDSFKALAHADEKPKPTDDATDGERDRARDLTTEDRGGEALGFAAGSATSLGGAAGRSAGAAPAKDAAEPSATTVARPADALRSVRVDAPKGKAQASFGGADDEALGFDTAGAVASTGSIPAAPPPPPAKPAPVVASPTSVAPTTSAPRRTNAPSSPPSEAPALAERPSVSSLDVITREEAKAERRRLGDLRLEQSEKKKKAAKESAPAREVVGGKGAEQERQAKAPSSYSKADDAKKSADKAPGPTPAAQAGPEQKRALQSEMALMSGYRELKEGRALGALDEFRSAERFDARRSLGSDPHVGQMRALVTLKRPAEALAIARRLVTRDLAEVGVADGLLLGAKIAEDLGDLRSARELWSALVKAPAHKAAALAALQRLANPPVRAQVDADAAAEAPAAAAPASKE